MNRSIAQSASRALLCIVVGLVSAPLLGQRYGYVRLAQGFVELRRDGEAAEIHGQEPLRGGDSLWVGRDGRLEAVLADGSRLRAAAETELGIGELRNELDSIGESNRLAMPVGFVQIVVDATGGLDVHTEVTSENASFLLRGAGTYLVAADGADWSAILVRQGFAEVVTDRGSQVVRAGEEVTVEGETEVAVSLSPAHEPDVFEVWANDLERRMASAGSERVPEDLRYESAALDGYGDWVDTDEGLGWQPEVDDDWQPYSDGYWRHTDAGLYWVSYEPWGWLPHHYGSWSYYPAQGWVWLPGAAFAPAHVVFYWGGQHVAWVPRAYYDHHFRHDLRDRRHASIYGYVSAPWQGFDRWVFCPTTYLGKHYQYRFHTDRRRLAPRYSGSHAPRGLVTTDTRELRPERLRQPDDLQRALHGRFAVPRDRDSAQLADLSPTFAAPARRSPAGTTAPQPRRVVSRGVTPAPADRGEPRRWSAERPVTSTGSGSRLPARPVTVETAGERLAPSRSAGRISSSRGAVDIPRAKPVLPAADRDATGRRAVTAPTTPGDGFRRREAPAMRPVGAGRAPLMTGRGAAARQPAPAAGSRASTPARAEGFGSRRPVATRSGSGFESRPVPGTVAAPSRAPARAGSGSTARSNAGRAAAPPPSRAPAAGSRSVSSSSRSSRSTGSAAPAQGRSAGAGRGSRSSGGARGRG